MAKVSWKSQLGLAAGLFALGTFAYWLEYKHKPETEETEEQAKKVFNIKETPVESVVVQNGGSTFAFNCLDIAAKLCKPADNSKWELTAPLKLKADDSNVNSVLSTFSNLAPTETIDLKEESPEKRAALLKDYGLDPAILAVGTTRKVQLKTTAGTITLHLGNTHPIGEGFFAVMEKDGKVDDARVFIVPSYFKTNIEHDLTYWRDKKIMTLAAHEVTAFDLDGTKAKVSGERKDGQWILKTSGKSGTEEFTGDIENVDSLISGATYLQARNFVSEKKTDAKAAAALAGSVKILTLNLTKGKDKPVTLTLYANTDAKKAKLYASLSNLDPLFELDTSSRDRVDKNLKDLRLAKLITSMERFSVKKMEFSGPALGDKPLTLAAEGSKWLLQPEKTEANNDRVQATLDKLSGNRIKDFLSGAAVPAGEQSGIKVTLSDDKGEKKRELVFWKVPGDKNNLLYARDLASKRKEAYVVDPVIFADLPSARDHYTKKSEPAASSLPAVGKSVPHSEGDGPGGHDDHAH